VSLQILPVRSASDRKAFLRLPWSIYPERHPAWVPPLLREERKRLDPDRNPFFQHGAVELFLALRHGIPVGRIAAVENTLHNEYHRDQVGFFGQFESVDDPGVAGALLEAAAAWLHRRGLTMIRGPVNFSLNEESGLLVDGFEDPPAILMTYNPPYYRGLLEGWGMTQAKDLWAWVGDRSVFEERRFRTLDRVIRRSGAAVQVRGLDMRDFPAEVDLVRSLYNRAWKDNWGFTPMTDAEVAHMARGLKPIIDPELALIGLVDGEPAGFALSLPDVNQALKPLNGRLFPFGFLRFLHGRKHIDRVRIITLGVLPEHRRTGLDALFYLETFRRATAKGYHGESSWVLEDNTLMNRALSKMGFRIYKTYRIYEKSL
jgi:GNAT superfamily N-acetyltransferase